MIAGTNTISHNKYYQGGNPIQFSWYGTDYDFNNWQTNSGFDQTGSSVGDPDLNANLHLNSSSTCIDAGLNTSAEVDIDYDGNNRTSQVDIGADEYNATEFLTIPPGPGIIGTGIGSYESVISVEEYDMGYTAKVFPTIATNYVNVQLLELEADEFILLDMSGKTILSGIANATDQLDVSTLVNGIYILKFKHIKKSFYIIKHG